jgi:murein L,D-transpeptidase YafK
MASAALAATVALSGCQTDGVTYAKAMRPLSPKMLAMLEEKSMAKESPILARLFKEESELEIWKQDASGRFALLKTYPICRWSGELGPKIREGDRQAPEGFYSITPGQMNPNSSYYLSVNMGYPNAFDRAHGRTGAHLMIHGDCSSRGCYAMTDEQISEIYALARESFFGGQQAFQIQAYPFRMTALNMAKHRNSPHLAFWKMLKQGNDHFEVTRLQPKVDVCEKRYVFDAEPRAGSTAPLRFNASAACPAYQINQEVLEAVADKRKSDDAQFAELVRRNTPTVAVRTGRDGGMHPTFLAKLAPRAVRDADGSVRYEVDPSVAKGLGSYVVPPRDPDTAPAETGSVLATGPRAPAMSLASAESKPATRVATAESDSAFSRIGSTVSRWVGLRGSEAATPPPQKPAPKAAPAARTATPAPKAKPQPEPAAEAAVRTTAANTSSAAASSTPSSAGLMSGATPVVPADSFANRFGTFR